jgi:hypothetical protein
MICSSLYYNASAVFRHVRVSARVKLCTPITNLA